MPLTLFKIVTRHHLTLCLIFIAAVAAAAKVAGRPAAALFQVPLIAPHTGNVAQGMQSRFISDRQNIHTHAASLVELGDGRIRAFWFAGSREGASDVEIRSAVYDPAGEQWSTEQTVATRETTQLALLRFVKKLGNPVAYRAPDGTIRLYFVTVSIGGWAGSSITTITSTDEGMTWSSPRRLITSPLLNISTLVKGTPYDYSDGSIGLPVYHEFIGKFGELLRISNNGAIIDKTRLSSGNTTLQPVVLIQTPQQATALMRDAGASPKRVLSTVTNDAGRQWSPIRKTALANPDAAISGVSLGDGKMLLVINDAEQGRDALSLVISLDHGKSWRTVYQLEDQRGQSAQVKNYAGVVAKLATASDRNITNPDDYANSAQKNKCEAEQCAFEFSYPYLIQAHNGDFHLVYTWNRSFIKHVRFNRAWLDSQIENSNHGQFH